QVLGESVVVAVSQESSVTPGTGHTLITPGCIPTAMAQQILCHQRTRLSYKDAFGYVIPVGETSLMTWVTDEGMIGTEGFDIEALAVFGVPAAIVGVSEESTLETLDDLMDAEVKAANLPAVQRRVEIGMSGREALNRM